MSARRLVALMPHCGDTPPVYNVGAPDREMKTWDPNPRALAKRRDTGLLACLLSPPTFPPSTRLTTPHNIVVMPLKLNLKRGIKSLVARITRIARVQRAESPEIQVRRSRINGDTVLDALSTGTACLSAIANNAVTVPGLQMAAVVAKEVVTIAQVCLEFPSSIVSLFYSLVCRRCAPTRRAVSS